MQKITPFLWFDDQAGEATAFYVSIFKNARVLDISRSGDGGAGSPGKVFSTRFVLDGQEFHALNGGPVFTFSPAISFFVSCHTQEEVDELWEKLSRGGEKMQCGWLKDKYGISWQIVPAVLGELLGDPDPVKSQRVMQAMLTMTKLEIAGLKSAHRGD